MVQEFREFINRGNVIDLGVAVILGAAAHNRMQRADPVEEPEPEAEPQDVVLLREIRDALATTRPAG